MYTREMTSKSQVEVLHYCFIMKALYAQVSLGVLLHDENKLDEMEKVLDHSLHEASNKQYSPCLTPMVLFSMKTTLNFFP